MSRLSPDEAASLEGVDGVNVIKYPTNRVYYIAFNNLTSGVDQPTEDPECAKPSTMRSTSKASSALCSMATASEPPG